MQTGAALFTVKQRERHTANCITVDMLNRKGNTRRVTLTDVARESGFAPSTVSIVLNEAPLSKNIADRTKEQIRSTAKRLGYRPDAFARSLRSRRSNAVGIMVFDLSDPFCSQILRGIDHALQSTGYLPIVMNANNDRGQLGGYFDLLMERRVEGLIVVANWIFEQGQLAEQLRASRLPAMLVGRDFSAENIGSIIVDNEQGGYLALQHLYELGHRKSPLSAAPRRSATVAGAGTGVGGWLGSTASAFRRSW